MFFAVTIGVFAVGVVGSLAVIFVLPHLPRRISPAERLASLPALPEFKTTITKRRAIRRPGIDYAAERRAITLALQGGMTVGQVAGVLRGSPQARRRRVVKVYRMLARPAAVPAQQQKAVTV